MMNTTGLLGSAIYETKEAWTGQDELCQANYALSPKVMGLMGIHDPHVLHHFKG